MSPTAHLTLVAPTPLRARALSSRPSSPHGQKQLTARRGSLSAPDPHGAHLARAPRSTLSRLTILRVPQPKAVADATAVGETRRQLGQSPSRTSSPHPASPSPSRLSFASASFSAPSSPTLSLRTPSPRPGSPSRMFFQVPSRPQSPFSSGRHSRTNSTSSQSSVMTSIHHFSPTQVYDLAKIASRPTGNVLPSGYTPPTSFIQLAEEVYLPFLDRSSEVNVLISSRANSKLMLLFARMLPSSGEDYYPRTSAELAATVGSWSFQDFTTWLTQVSREEIEDAAWVHALRTFVRPKSEVLWERVKSMLGVPPELDVENFGYSSYNSSGSSAPITDPPINIVQIHPTPIFSALHLDSISEVVGQHLSDVAAADAAKQVFGLRICTPIGFPPSSSKCVSPVSHARSRTPTQGSVPVRSSPLVPKSSGRQCFGLDSPTQNGVKDHGFIPGKRAAARPMFPYSFDKLGQQPSLLSPSR